MSDTVLRSTNALSSRVTRIRQLALELEYELDLTTVERDEPAQRLWDEAYREMRMAFAPFGQVQEPDPREALRSVLRAMSGHTGTA